MSEEAKAFRRLCKEQFTLIANKYLFMTKKELLKAYKDENTLGIDRMFIGNILKGDLRTLQFMQQSLVGKNRSHYEAEDESETPLEQAIDDMTPEQVEARAAELIAKAKGGK